MLRPPSLIALLWCALVTSGAQASSVALEFGSLPSTQGWTYNNVAGDGPEATVYCVDPNCPAVGGGLFQDTVTLAVGLAEYRRFDLSSPSKAFVLEFHAEITGEFRPVPSSGAFGFAFNVTAEERSFLVGIGMDKISFVSTDGTSTIDVPVATGTGLHRFLLRGDPATGSYELFRDDLTTPLFTGAKQTPALESRLAPFGLLGRRGVSSANDESVLLERTWARPRSRFRVTSHVGPSSWAAAVRMDLVA